MKYAINYINIEQYLILVNFTKQFFDPFYICLQAQAVIWEKILKCQTKQTNFETNSLQMYPYPCSVHNRKNWQPMCRKIVQNARSPDPSFTQFVWMELIIKRKCFTYRSTFHLVIRIAPLIPAPSTFVFDLVEKMQIKLCNRIYISKRILLNLSH